MSATTLSTRSNTVSGIKFQTIDDIPNLHLWLDASDNNSINLIYNPEFLDEFWLFTGVNSYIYTDASINFAYGTDQFTVEAWIYPLARNNKSTIYCQTRSGLFYFQFFVLNDGRISFFDTATRVTTIQQVPLNEWSHVALTREGIGTDQTKIYINGALAGSGTSSFNFTDTSQNRPTIGRLPHADAEQFIGYISNIRVVKGKAVYTNNFDPYVDAAVPLQPISEPGVITPLLALQDSIATNNNGNVPNIILTDVNIILSNIPLVSFWLDKSPNALTASQTVLNNQATFLSGEVNGLNIIDFDGVDDHFNLSSPIALSGNFSHFFVYRRSNVTPVNISLGNKATGVQSSYRHHSDNFIYSGNRRTNSSVVSATTLIGGLRKNEYLQVDLEPKLFTSVWSSITNNVNALGIYNNNSYQKGPMCEVIHTSSMLPNYEIDLVNSKLFDKWKVPKQVPFLKTAPTIENTTISNQPFASNLGTWFIDPNLYGREWLYSTNGINFASISNTLKTITPSNLNGYPSEIDYIDPRTSEFNLPERGYLMVSITAYNSFGASVPVSSNIIYYDTTQFSDQLETNYNLSGFAVPIEELNVLNIGYLGSTSIDQLETNYGLSGFAVPIEELNVLNIGYLGSTSIDQLETNYGLSGFACLLSEIPW
jgi:hypothetical protein